MNLLNDIQEAVRRIRPHVRQTPLDYFTQLSKETGVYVYLKCEHLQYTSSFKIRGAFNKLLSLSASEKKQGIVTASTGNHGAAIAYGLNQLKLQGTIFVPENASQTKINNIHQYGGQLTLHGMDGLETETHARAYAQQQQMIFISPYNDLQVIAGQGSIGYELMQQLKEIDAIFVPVGGGGLITGIAAYIKQLSPTTQVIGCLPENSPVMAASIQQGHIIPMPYLPTLSDATAGSIEADAITFDLCKTYVDDYITVTEAEISRAIQLMLAYQHQLIEGAAGVALAALCKNSSLFQNKRVVVILSGANISMDTLKAIL